MSLKGYLEKKRCVFLALERALQEAGTTQERVRLSLEYSKMCGFMEKAQRWEVLVKEIEETRGLVEEGSGGHEFLGLCAVELEKLGRARLVLEEELKRQLLPRPEGWELAAILEVRAGTGGEEASLFARDLLRMYTRCLSQEGFAVEMMSLSSTEVGGIRYGILDVQGEGAFGFLQLESGVHRVQRVPTTESGGRVHTSAATVAVLPEPRDLDIKIEEKDLRIDVFRASGPGGQSVNTTDSAVRITHLPSSLVVSQQDEKSQHKNKARALKILKARLYDLELRKQQEKRAEKRRGQVGTGDRSERIRTYNFPQGRLTDHRFQVTVHNLEKILQGEELGVFMRGLHKKQEERLLEGLDFS